MNRTPVIVGAAQLNGRDGDNEPIEMMTAVSKLALAQGRVPLDQVRVVKGIWPYADPGALVADRLGISVTTGLTQLGGNEAYDLLNTTAADIAAGRVDAVLICGAETMRTRRRHKKAGQKSPYIDEATAAMPDHSFGSDLEFWEDADFRAWGLDAVNFYAMAASTIRNRNGQTPAQYLSDTADLWASGSKLAAGNPHAWIQHETAAAEIATSSANNRMVADPFPKLMTSNINVDQSAAMVMCSTEVARAAGIDPGSWVFPVSGTGGYDPLLARTRRSFGESPSMRIAGGLALDLAQVSLEDVSLLDLYSCFPAAVQTAQHELQIDPARPFTITGGMTFAGGPFNTYCLHAYARAVELLREDPGNPTKPSTAFLSGNGGWFTKHSFCVLSTEPPTEFMYERPQAEIDAEPTRSLLRTVPTTATIDAYTVGYDRDGAMEKAIIAIADEGGARAWATSSDPDTMQRLIDADQIGQQIRVSGDLPVLDCRL